jgi:hypothetical protein
MQVSVRNVMPNHLSRSHLKTTYVNIPTTAKYAYKHLGIWNVIYDSVTKYFIGLLKEPGQLRINHKKKKKILPKKKKRFEYGNVITESLIVLDDSLFPFRDKLNCAVKLEKPSYLEVLPQEDGMEGYIQWHWIKRHS